MLVLLALAGLLRLLVERRSIAGVTQDSLIYIRLTPHAPFAPFSPSRPSGYPLIMRLLGLLPGRDLLDIVTAAQHAAGVAVGAMVYLLSVRAGVRRSLALVAAGITLVDAHTVALEQVILAETFFTLTLVASVFLVVNGRFGTPAVAASGLLLGLACLIRTVGLFVVPVWLAWVVLGRFGRRAVLAGLAGVVVPVLAYCTLHAAEGAGFSIVQSDGWYLYAKVAPVADCAGASIPEETRPLCAGARGMPFEFYLYDAASPPFRLFHGGRGMDLEEAVTPHNNRLLRQFSLGVIRAHPVPFLREVVKEFVRYLGPTTAQNELSLYPEEGSVLAWYERTFHLDWWMVVAAFAGGVALVIVGRRSREAGLLVGTAAALVLGAAATSGFNSRYLLPALPLLAPTLTLALEEASGWYRSRRERVSRAGPSGGGRRRPGARSPRSRTSRRPGGCASRPA
ncbi:MAG: phospholipid carrier-dependent glycosyltransferase [Actinomycetota bacterium]|nr:phospholipid carrier-dependent glycosyltransferase [Actinomycetota bacterium]